MPTLNGGKRTSKSNKVAFTQSKILSQKKRESYTRTPPHSFEYKLQNSSILLIVFGEISDIDNLSREL